MDRCVGCMFPKAVVVWVIFLMWGCLLNLASNEWCVLLTWMEMVPWSATREGSIGAWTASFSQWQSCGWCGEPKLVGYAYSRLQHVMVRGCLAEWVCGLYASQSGNRMSDFPYVEMLTESCFKGVVCSLYRDGDGAQKCHPWRL